MAKAKKGKVEEKEVAEKPVESKKEKVEKIHIKKTFEDDIIKFLKDKDNKLDIDVGFMTETGSNVSRWLDTNSYTWNFLSSGRLDRGLPYGRVIEVFGDNFTGKSLLACQLAVQGQKDNAIVVYFDPERSIDDTTINRLGGDPSVIIAPKAVKTIEKFNDTFTKIIENIASHKDNDRPIIVILDSLAMLSTNHEMEAPDKVDYTKQKKIRQFFRMYMDDCARYNVLLFVVNQVYDNIGVMFGCHSWDTKINTINGKMPIGQLVNNKIDTLVYSLNTQTNEIEAKPITNWFKNGKAEYFNSIKIKISGERRCKTIKTTNEHIMYVKRNNNIAEIPVKELKTGDVMISYEKYKTSKLFNEFIEGSILGDGSIRKRKNNSNRASLRIGHGRNQNEYCKWKYDLVKNISNDITLNSKGGLSFDTNYDYNLYQYWNKFYKRDKKIVPDELVLTPFSLAIWYLDDGTYEHPVNGNNGGYGRASICFAGFSDNDKEKLLQKTILLFKEKNIFIDETSIHINKSKKNLVFDSKTTYELHKLIALYVHPSMAYKIHNDIATCCNINDLELKDTVKPTDFAEICSIKKYYRKNHMEKYDIEVDGNSNYFANNVLVHNSKTKPHGGQGLTYASSQRYGLLSPVIEKSDADSDVVATKVKAKSYKNRNSIPFRSVYIRSTYKSGFDRYGGLWELLTDGDAGKVIGFNIIDRVKRDEKTKEWIVAKTGSKYMLKGIIQDEDGKDMAFSAKDFIDLLKVDEKKKIKQIQEIIDRKNDDVVPGVDSLTEAEKILAGVDEGGNLISDKELMESEIKDLKNNKDK